MICPTCHGLSASAPIFPPCPDCIGGVASCCDSAGSAQPEMLSGSLKQQDVTANSVQGRAPK